ncbi:hypothetical protein [Moorena sp. SIOASIH]|nr:hypothetical protein [Moorena sp. SIOASIH]
MIRKHSAVSFWFMLRKQLCGTGYNIFAPGKEQKLLEDSID